MLVVVHPGSACGSADFNLGLIEGSRVRERLARTILGWTDEIVVVDNDLSDELETYAMLGLAIANASGRKSAVRVGGDSGKSGWAENVAGQICKVAKHKNVYLTGAWHQPSDEQGCIDRLSRILRRDHGIDSSIMPCSLVL
ncbi:MAG: hypothetical protein CL949_10010 [Erythrobacter sp.]|nr:hypothetical protein [Erythrobacter sp.]